MQSSEVARVPNETPGVIAAVVAVVAFGTGNVLVKLIDMPGLHLVLWRLAGAAALYWVVMSVRGGRLSADLFRATFSTGLFFGGNIAVGYLAVKETTVANASIIGALQPLFVVAFVSQRFGEVLQRWLLIVIPVAFVGTALVILGSSGTSSWSPVGDSLAVVSMLLWVGYFAAAKRARSTVPVIELQATSLIWASIFIAPFSIANGALSSLPTTTSALGIASLILVPGTGHALMNWSHAHIEISLASLLTLAVPALSTVGAFVFLDEPIVLLQVLGMAVVLAALGYTVRRSVAREQEVPIVPPRPR